LPTKGNSSKNAKKKEHNVDKKEVFQAHAIQIQTLQNELESLRAQLANLQSKLSQPYFEENVRMRLTLPEWELGSPLGLPKLQSLIARVKTPCIVAFFILESY
jgi:dynactin complex subunit